jgi:hypothetical protein
MTKPELGTKRLCARCGAKFYDLHHSQVTCPKCETVFEVVQVSSRWRSEAARPPSAATSRSFSDLNSLGHLRLPASSNATYGFLPWRPGTTDKMRRRASSRLRAARGVRERSGEQASGLRRRVHATCVGAPHDGGETKQRLGRKTRTLRS